MIWKPVKAAVVNSLQKQNSFELMILMRACAEMWMNRRVPSEVV